MDEAFYRSSVGSGMAIFLSFRKMTLAAREDGGSLSQPPHKPCASLLVGLSVSLTGVQASVSKAASSNLSKLVTGVSNVTFLSV